VTHEIPSYSAEAGDRPRPLDGITVVSIEQAVAAPFATRQLADLGAQVIKVERPGSGDFARQYDDSVRGLSSYFVWLNRSKQSLTLDLKHPAARTVMGRLVDAADVVVSNLAPGATERLGLSATALRHRRDRLIVCEIRGYASDGPYAGRRAYDLLIQSEAGLVSVTGSPDQSGRTGVSIADISAGMYGFSAVLAALFTRERSGLGAQIEVPLFESLVEWMAQPVYYAMHSGQVPGRFGIHHPTIAPYGRYGTSGGGAVLFAVQNEREWRRLCNEVLEDKTLAEDPRFDSNVARVRNRVEMDERISAVLAGLSAEQVIGRLERASIANGRLNSVADVAEHPQLRDRWIDVGSPAGPLPALPPPIRMSGFDPLMQPIPSVGQHTDEVLAALGFTAHEVKSFRSRGVV
jgi:itaconate CoA-transferase